MRENKQIFVGEEFNLRFSIWLTNYRIVQEHNRAGESWKSSLNHLSVLTPAEYNSILNYRRSIPKKNKVQIIIGDAPDEKDWRTQGVVNQVKDQGSCASGWAFSVIAAQETQWAIKKNELVKLSEQNLVDCVTVCYGCRGGDGELAYDYVIDSQEGSFCKDEDYPYVASTEICKYKKEKGCTKISSYYRPTVSQNEEQLRVACGLKGAVSVAIDASGWQFQTYSSGIYNPGYCSSGRPNHEVTLVGYGKEKDKPFWIIRNSWSANWGEKGYMRLIRNSDNKCGIADDTLIPIVE